MVVGFFFRSFFVAFFVCNQIPPIQFYEFAFYLFVLLAALAMEKRAFGRAEYDGSGDFHRIIRTVFFSLFYCR